MSKAITITLSVMAAAIAAAGAFVWMSSTGEEASQAQFSNGSPQSQLILPVPSRKEERIVRHPHADGSADDDVDMRDGTTKHIVYDTRKVLRQVTAYYKAANKDEPRGPVMYEKTHDASGHLASEKHLRPDGSLEMDGTFKPDGTYVRHTYFAPSESTSPQPQPEGKGPVVSSEKSFDKWWHPQKETQYRADSTRALTHTWGDGLDETVTTYAEDGVKKISDVTTGRGRWYTAIYYPDGANIKVEAVNTYNGTILQWYKEDHSFIMRVAFTSMHSDNVVLPEPGTDTGYQQVWYPDYNKDSKDGKRPLRLDHVDHLKADEKIDMRYDFDPKTQKLTTVTVYHTDESWGPREIYTVDADGWATSVKSFDDKGNSKGSTLTRADGKRFVLDKVYCTYPKYELPPLKEGLNLYGMYAIYGR